MRPQGDFVQSLFGPPPPAVPYELLPFPALVTAVTQDAAGFWRYAFLEQSWDPATGAWASAVPGRFGDVATGIGLAFEANNQRLTPPFVVNQMRPRGLVGGQVVCDFDAPGSGPGGTLSGPVLSGPTITGTVVENTTAVISITGNTNNLNLGTAQPVALVSPTGNFSLTGLVPPAAPAAGQVVLQTLLNVSTTNTLTLTHLDGGSTPANQFDLPGSVNYPIPPRGSVTLVYYPGTTNWLVDAPVSASLLQGNPVTPAAPAAGQALVWDATAGQWKPGAPRPAVQLATTAALPANTYANGTAGVGATLTGNVNGSIGAVDGTIPSAGDRVLTKDEATAANKGVYTVTTVGDASHKYVLTRATDMDEGGEFSGAFLPVKNGTANAGTCWICTNSGGITVGTTAVTFGQVVGNGKASVSADDATPDYLENKLAAGSGITLTETNEGGNETLTIAASGGGSPGIAASISGVTVTGSTTQTTLTGTLSGSLTLAANYFSVGTVLRVHAWGSAMTINSPRTCTVRAKVGTQVVGHGIFTNGVGGTVSGPWQADFYIYCTATGASGTLKGQGKTTSNSSNQTAYFEAQDTATVDTTGALALDFTAQLSNGADTITCNLVTFEKVQ